MRWANPNTESIRNFALPGGMWVIDSRLISSPLRQTKCYKRKTIVRQIFIKHKAKRASSKLYLVVKESGQPDQKDLEDA